MHRKDEENPDYTSIVRRVNDFENQEINQK